MLSPRTCVVYARRKGRLPKACFNMAVALTPEMRIILEDAAKRGVVTAQIVLGRHKQRAPKARPADDEFHIQSEFFAAIMADPILSDLPIYAVPNFSGHFGTVQSRMQHGARAKANGRRKGVPDVSVDVARAGWHGLRIEFKTDTGSVSPEQRDWRARLERHGYHVVVCRSAADACNVLNRYLAASLFRNGDRPVFGTYPGSRKCSKQE